MIQLNVLTNTVQKSTVRLKKYTIQNSTVRFKDPPPPGLQKKYILVRSCVEHTAFSDQNFFFN